MSRHEISCSDALDQLWALLDQEIGDDDADLVREHIERCSHCYPQYDFDRAYRELLALQCREQAPPELRRRIFMRLLEEGA
ncbi:MAG TPA: mycothiol system anti-sigma-R factor [Longimicrobiales bacterium]